MYCKHCGKLISDDSKYCQYCGGNLEIKISDLVDISKHCEKEDVVPQNEGSSIIQLIGKYKIWIVIYCIWVVVNFILLLQGVDKIYEKSTFSSGALYGNTFHSNEVFYPFTSIGYQTSFWFNAKYYDWTESLVYCLLLPLVIYIVITAWKNYGCGSVIAKLDTQFDERIKDNILKTSSEIERTDVLKEKDDEYRYNDTISSSHDEFDSKSFAIYSSDEGINNVSEQLIEFVITALKIVGIIVISFFALVISLMYIHNLILGCVSSLVVGTLAYFLFRTRNSSNESKYERSPLYYVGLVIFAFFLLFLLFKFGEGMILSNINNPSQTPLDKQVRVEKVLSLEEQYISEIKIAKTKLPIVLDEYVSWTNIRRKSNGMLECDYLIDDANSDLYLIDLSAYKVELANKLKLISYKKYLELCMYSGYGLNCHLISKWDRSKSVDITFVNAEIGEILKGD